MTKAKNLIYLLIFGGTLLALKFLLIDKFFAASPKDANIWFTSGLLLVILGVFVTEKYFTRSLDVIVNVITLFVVLLTLDEPTHFRFWTVVVVYASVVGIIALASFVLYDEHRDQNHWTQRIANAGSNIARFFGSSRFLFSLMFILSIFNYFVFSLDNGLAISPQQISILLLIVFWGAVLLIEPIDRKLIQPLIDGALKKQSSRVVAKVVRRTSPHIVVGEQMPDAPLLTGGTLFVLDDAKASHSDGHERHALMYLYAEDGENKRFAFFYSLDGKLDDIADRVYLHSLDSEAHTELASKLSANDLVQNRSNLIGFVHTGSTIDIMKIKMVEGVDEEKKLKEGDLVSVTFYGVPTKYQIINVETSNENVDGANRQGLKIITAQQIGRWRGEEQKFEETGWVPEVNAPVFVESTMAEIADIGGDFCRIGVVPKSQYPIYINLEDSVTHHIAIIGKTGTGKSQMAAKILKKIAAGYRVLILEVDRKHGQSLTRYIDESLKEEQDSDTFDLSKATKPMISVNFPIDTTAKKSSGTVNLSDMAAALIEKIIKYQTTNEDQKLCIALEEAYDFIPESTFGQQGFGQPVVSRISQMVLKCRKHNIGFLIITQRTALVTKTILYQCHTIIALQSFDETSKTFMSAYINQRYLDSMSILPRFRAIVVGKGSSCDKPVIVDFYDKALVKKKEAAVPTPAANQ